MYNPKQTASTIDVNKPNFIRLFHCNQTIIALLRYYIDITNDTITIIL